LLGKEVADDPLTALDKAANLFRAAIMVKGATSHLMADGHCLSYAGGGLSLAVSGSGDILAGLIASFGAQGCRRSKRPHGAYGCMARPDAALPKPWGRSAISRAKFCRSSPA